MTTSLPSRSLPEAFNVLAPDGSEIRLLVQGGRGSMVHCRLPAGSVTLAVSHRTVEEVWYGIAGRGSLWRMLERNGGREEDTVVMEAGVSAVIPTGAHFQFRADAEAPLDVLIVTMPPWPGPDEAVRVPDHWPPTVTENPGNI